MNDRTVRRGELEDKLRGVQGDFRRIDVEDAEVSVAECKLEERRASLNLQKATLRLLRLSLEDEICRLNEAVESDARREAAKKKGAA